MVSALCLKAWRAGRRWSQIKLAVEFGVSENLIKDFERG
jgi:transcriptional regulator with XRE-family HTH domain